MAKWQFLCKSWSQATQRELRTNLKEGILCVLSSLFIALVFFLKNKFFSNIIHPKHSFLSSLFSQFPPHLPSPQIHSPSILIQSSISEGILLVQGIWVSKEQAYFFYETDVAVMKFVLIFQISEHIFYMFISRMVLDLILVCRT